MTPASKKVWIGPVYYGHNAEQTSTAIFPIAWFGKNHTANTSTSAVLPFYLDVRRTEDRQLAAYSPLVWRYHSVEATTTSACRSTSTSTVTASRAPPAFCRCSSATARRVDHDTAYAMPALLTWWRTRDDHTKSDAVVFPIFWHFGGEQPDDGAGAASSGTSSAASRAPPSCSRCSRTGAARCASSTLVLNVYYGKGLGDAAGSWHLDVFPLLQLGRPRKQDIEWYFLEGLFGYSRQGRNRNLRLFWVLDFPLEPVPASNLSWFGSTPTESRELF